MRDVKRQNTVHWHMKYDEQVGKEKSIPEAVDRDDCEMKKDISQILKAESTATEMKEGILGGRNSKKVQMQKKKKFTSWKGKERDLLEWLEFQYKIVRGRLLGNGLWRALDAQLRSFGFRAEKHPGHSSILEILIWLGYAKARGAERTRDREITENPCQVQVWNDGSGTGKVEGGGGAGNTEGEAH